ncbi:WD repeat-containing protein 87 [Peromyscus eremicus]|uniref:WD repeat-containing protein 87 n=1 Tax=Peromyscus eremicus TaxID=42410 RepID=UPI0027DAFB23|nr:WD repeat-containing protein 87 [Peromyscus eremicus]
MPSTRLIPKWNQFLLSVNEAIQKTKKPSVDEKSDAVVLSDRSKILFKESRYPQPMPRICHYFVEADFFASLSWVTTYTKETLAVVWMKNKTDDMVEKRTFLMTEGLPPIQSVVHTGSFHLIVTYCGDMILRLFGDHFRAFKPLCTVPCRFDISCLCYDPETQMLLSGIVGGVVTWTIELSGKGLEMVQMFPIPGDELVQNIVLNGPKGCLVALCETVLRVLDRQGFGRLVEVQRFTAANSGSPITCCLVGVDTNLIYAGNKAGEIHVWNLSKSLSLHSFRAHPSLVVCIHNRLEAHTLLTAGKEGVIKEWNLTSGNLLRRLELGEVLYRLEFIDNSTFFCQTTHNFSLYRLPCFYSLFNVCGSAPQQLRRIYCKDNCFRILCTTEDGLLRFLSPITGDLLVITWPFSVLDRAVDWAYDPGKEELVVATGTSEVLVFDTSRNPCPVKYLLCTSPDVQDFVQCLAYGNFHLGRGLEGLIFSGHQSGTIRVLSQHSCARIEKVMHFGAVLALSALYGGILSSRENSLLCSYGVDDYIQLSEAVLTGTRLQLRTLASILSSCHLKHLVLLPKAVGAITDTNCLRLWKFHDFLSFETKQGTRFIETLPLHQCTITSFDVCLPLSLFVTGGSDGSVRIWDFHGKLIAMLDSSLQFGALCFANDRADLLVTFNQSIYLVSCLELLPTSMLSHLALMSITDDMVEIPVPFAPSFFLSFETIFVPKYSYQDQRRQDLEGLASLVNKRAIAFDLLVPHVIEEEDDGSTVLLSTPRHDSLEGTDLAKTSKQPQSHYVSPPQLHMTAWDGLNPYQIIRCYFGQGKKWLIAPDCYIPNSVIRARLWPEGCPIFLQCSLHSPQRDLDWEKDQPFFWHSRIRATSKTDRVLEKEDESFLEMRLTKDITYSVLTDAANRSWLGKKMSELAISSLIEAILSIMTHANPLKYQCCIGALGQIFAAYQVSPTLRSETAHRLLDDTTHSNPFIRELAWEGLKRLGMITHLFALPLAQGLMDKDPRVRNKAMTLMPEIGIHSKSSLLHLMQKPDIFRDLQQEMIGEESLDHLLGMRPTDIQILITQVERRLHENLSMSKYDKKPDLFSDLPGLTAPSKSTSLLGISALAEPEVKPSKSQRRVRTAGKKHARKVLRGLRKAKEAAKQRREEETIDQGEAEQAEDLTAGSPVKSPKDTDVSEKDLLKDHISVAMKLKKRLKISDKKALKLSKRKKKKIESEVAVVGEEILPPVVEHPPLRRRPGTSKRGIGGTPGRVLTADSEWRDDLCRLMNLRIAGSQTQMMDDLSNELLATAQEVLLGKHPSWELFREICPLVEEEERGGAEEGWEGASQEEKLVFLQEEEEEEGEEEEEKSVFLHEEEEEEEEEEEMPEKDQETKEGEGGTHKKGRKKEVAFLEPGESVRGRGKLRKEGKKAKKAAKQEKMKEGLKEKTVSKEELTVSLRLEEVAEGEEEVAEGEEEVAEAEETPKQEERRLSWQEWKKSWDEWQKVQLQRSIAWEEWKKEWDRKLLEEQEKLRAQGKLQPEPLPSEGVEEVEKKRLNWDEWKQVWEKTLTKTKAEMELDMGEALSEESEESEAEGEEELLTEEQKLIREAQREARAQWKQARAERERAREQSLLAKEEEKLAQEEKRLAQEERKLAQEYVKRVAARGQLPYSEMALGEKEEKLAQEEEFLSQQAEQLAQKKRKLARKLEKLAREEERVAKKMAKVAEVNVVLAQKVEAIAQKELNLDWQEKQLKEEEKSLEWDRRELAWKEDELNEEEEQLDEKRETLLEEEKMLDWYEENLTMEEKMLAQEEELLMEEERELAQKEDRTLEEETLLERRERLRERRGKLAQDKEGMARKKKELGEKKNKLAQAEATLAQEKHMLLLEKERLAERETALQDNEDKLLKGREQIQDTKYKLETYKEKLVHVAKRLEEEKQDLQQKREKLAEAERKLEEADMILAEKQGKLAQEKMKFADEMKVLMEKSKLFREEAEIAEEGMALTTEMKKLAEEKMKLAEEAELPSRRGTREEIVKRRRLTEHVVSLMKKRVSLEEKILVYEDRLLATKEKNHAREKLELSRGQRMRAHEERKLARAVRKMGKERGVSRELAQSRKSLKALQKLVSKERKMTQKETKITKIKRSLLVKEDRLSAEENRLDVKELDASEEQPEVIKDEKKLAKMQRRLAKQMRRLDRQEQRVAEEESEFDYQVEFSEEDEDLEAEEEDLNVEKLWRKRTASMEPLPGTGKFYDLLEQVVHKESFSKEMESLLDEVDVERESLYEEEREEWEEEEEEEEEAREQKEEVEEEVEEEEEEEEKEVEEKRKKRKKKRRKVVGQEKEKEEIEKEEKKVRKAHEEEEEEETEESMSEEEMESVSEEEEEEEKHRLEEAREEEVVKREKPLPPPLLQRRELFPPIGRGLSELRGSAMRLGPLKSPLEKPTPVADEAERKRPSLLEVKEQTLGEEIAPVFEPSKISLRTMLMDKQRELLEKYKLGPPHLSDAVSEYEPPAVMKPLTSQVVRRAVQTHRVQHETSQTKWLVKHHPPARQATGQVPLPEILTEEQHPEAGISNLEWVYKVLEKMAAGEELPRDSFHKLCQLLRDLTSTGNLEWLHLAILEAIVHRHKQIVDSRSTVTSKPSREPMSPKHLKVIPPIKGKETKSWQKPSAVSIPGSPLATKGVTDPKAVYWHLLGEPYRSARMQHLSSVLEEMETQSFDPTTGDILAGAHSSMNKQTLALMFQKDLGDLKGKSRYPKLPKLEKKPLSKKKEEVPPWETFLALYHVLQMLQQRYAKDMTTWMEKFYQLMDLYQIKSPRIQRLLQDLLLRKPPQSQEFVSKETLGAVELVPGERLFYCLVCGGSHPRKVPLEFREVVPLPEQNNVRTIHPKGIAKYGILELAWKSLPQADIHLTKKAPHLMVPTP